MKKALTILVILFSLNCKSQNVTSEKHYQQIKPIDTLKTNHQTLEKHGGTEKKSRKLTAIAFGIWAAITAGIIIFDKSTQSGFTP